MQPRNGYLPKARRFVKVLDGRQQPIRGLWTRHAPDSQWLFPSPQRADADRPARTFWESLRLVRTAAGLPRFGFHDLRHYFISHSVMSGIDFMTIAKWVGHKDGGVLIGRVYGHLADDHRRRMAAIDQGSVLTMNNAPERRPFCDCRL